MAAAPGGGDGLADSVRGLARGYAFHAQTSQYGKVYREVARDLRRALGESSEAPEPDPLRRAAELMRAQHGPDHERHEMWSAMADWLDDTVGDSYLGSVVRGRALAVANAYLEAAAATAWDQLAESRGDYPPTLRVSADCICSAITVSECGCDGSRR